MSSFIQWFDVIAMDSLLTDELKDAGKNPSEDNKKKLWLMVLDELPSVIKSAILYGGKADDEEA